MSMMALCLALAYGIANMRFRKKPYSSEQRLSVLFAAGQKAMQIKYRGLFVDVLPKTDAVVNAEVMNPALGNFFGFGNNTTINNDSTIKILPGAL